MRRLTLVLALLFAPLLTAFAQEEHAPDGLPIESAEVSGLPLNQLSPGLRQAIEALVGTPLSRDHVAELAERIEAERPEVVTAVRTMPRPDAKARVVFLVARINDDPDLQTNINSRYIVEDVSISGVDESRLSQSLRGELRTLVGARLDSELAERLRGRIASELPGRRVRRRVSRGSQRGQIHVVFDVTTPPWIPFAPSRSKYTYHGDQGWSGVLDLGIDGGPHRLGIGLVFGDKDDLIENYRGYWLRGESRKLGTERLGASLEFSSLRQSWNRATLDALAADPAIPGAYRSRRSIEPTLTFAFTPHVRISAGFSSSQLQPIDEGRPSMMANAMTASIAFDQRWRVTSGSHRLSASYLLRNSTDGLDSDFTYKRHLGQVRYQFDHRHNTLVASASFGHIGGVAPLFERFSLGDTSELRGWNKFDLAPAGADNKFSQSVEYRFHDVALFLDSGALWRTGGEAKLRLSTGFGFNADNVFALVGFPLNADKVAATFMMGLRF